MADYAGQDEFHDTITVLPDNVQPSALNFALATEGLADRTKFLLNRGFGGIYTQTSQLTSGTTGEAYGATGGSGSSFVEFAAGNGLTPYVDVPGCAVGDIVIAWVSGHFCSQGNLVAGYSEIKLYAQFNVGGSPPPAAEMSGAWARVEADVADAPQPITLVGWKVVTTAGTCRVRLRGKNPNATGVDQSAFVTGIKKLAGGTQYPLALTALRLRPTASWDDA